MGKLENQIEKVLPDVVITVFVHCTLNLNSKIANFVTELSVFASQSRKSLEQVSSKELTGLI